MNAANSSLSDVFWEPSRSLTLSAARKHTQFIKVLRIFFLGAALALLGVLAFFIMSGRSTPAALENYNDSVRMTNPRYTGVDGDGQPYSLTADYAVRGLENPNAVRLANPVLGFLRAEGASESQILAQEGVYDTNTQTLEFSTDVVVETDDGYRCVTSRALITTQDKTVSGDEPIRCEGRFGHLEGARFEILDDYSRFIFLDNVKGVLLPDTSNRLETVQPDAQQSGQRQ